MATYYFNRKSFTINTVGCSLVRTPTVSGDTWSFDISIESGKSFRDCTEGSGIQNVYYDNGSSEPPSSVEMYSGSNSATITITCDTKIYLDCYDDSKKVASKAGFPNYTSFTKPADRKKNGYVFAGWTYANGTAVEFPLKLSETTNIYAKWVRLFTVTFTDGQNNVLKTETVEYGKSATAPANPTRTGYTFSGWDKSYSNITADTTVNATWNQKKTITVTTSSSTSVGSFVIKNYYGTVVAKQSNGKCTYTANQNEVFTIDANYAIDSKLVDASVTVNGSIKTLPYTFTVGSSNISMTGTLVEKETYEVKIVCDRTKGSVKISPPPDKGSNRWLSQKLTFTLHSNKGYTPATFSAVKTGTSETVISNAIRTWSDEDSVQTEFDIESNVTATLTFNTGSYIRLARLDGASHGRGTVTPATPVNVSAGSSTTFKAVSVDSNLFTFGGWYDSEGTIKSSNASYTVSSTAADVVLFAKFSVSGDVTSCTVNAGFENSSMCGMGSVSIGGKTTSDGQRSVSFTGNKGDEVVASVSVANGYKFVGWYSGSTLVSSAPYFRMFVTDRTLLARFEALSDGEPRLMLWEGSEANKTATWRSKTYVASVPFNPSACRVDATGYPVKSLTVDMFSSPDVGAKVTGRSTLNNVASQNSRRLPVRRPERYLQVEVVSDSEVDAVLVGTSMKGLAV